MISAAALCFCLFNILQFLLNYNKTAQTVGTIISIKTPGPETSKFRNSKWAVVSYKVKGRIYQSHNRIQVPVSHKSAEQKKYVMTNSLRKNYTAIPCFE